MLLCLGIALLFAGLANANTLGARSYYSWQWGGFSRSSPSLTTASLGSSSTSSSFSLLSFGTSSSAATSARSTVSDLSEVASAVNDGVILAGAVYYDQDGDGIRSSSDWGIFEATVSLTQTSTGTVLTTTTASDGSYSFDGLEAGDYTVRLLTPSVEPESPSIGIITNSSGVVSVGSGTVASTSAISAIHLDAGDDAEDYDFPQLQYPTSLLSKRMLLDSNPGVQHTTPSDPKPVPEPGSLALLAVAGLSLGATSLKKRRKA
jgi:hypothetical protein